MTLDITRRAAEAVNRPVTGQVNDDRARQRSSGPDLRDGKNIRGVIVYDMP